MVDFTPINCCSLESKHSHGSVHEKNKNALKGLKGRDQQKINYQGIPTFILVAPMVMLGINIPEYGTKTGHFFSIRGCDEGDSLCVCCRSWLLGHWISSIDGPMDTESAVQMESRMWFGSGSTGLVSVHLFLMNSWIWRFRLIKCAAERLLLLVTSCCHTSLQSQERTNWFA